MENGQLEQNFLHGNQCVYRQTMITGSIPVHNINTFFLQSYNKKAMKEKENLKSFNEIY